MALSAKKKRFDGNLLFYVLMMAFPVLQFCIFYIGVNARSFLYAFQRIDIKSGEVTWTMEALKNAFDKMVEPTLLTTFGTSFLAFLLTYLIGTILALLFSYFIFKKLPMSNFFKVMLFLPSILSAIVTVTIYQNFVETAIPAIHSSIFHQTIAGLIQNPDTRFGTIIFYNILVSFGTNVLMYSNAMSGLSTEIIEAAKIDGANSWQEFFHIVLPGIFPTITTFAVTSVASIFVNQLNLFSFFGGQAPEGVQTYGYYLYVQTISANSEAEYPIICAIGLFLTIIAVPLTLIVKYLLERFGPSED